MEDLRKVSAMTALSRTRRLAAIGQNTPGETPPVAHVHAEPTDVAHRSAMAAYAQTAKPDVQRHPLTLVGDIWTPNVVTIADTASVGDAWHLLAERGVGQMPVVAADGTLVGLVTRADLTRPDRLPGADMHPLVWRALLAQSVVDVMWTPVPSVSLDTDIRRVARVLLDTGLPGLPVVQDNGLVIGFVSRTDILRAVVADPPLDLWT
jgi:CBS domain-containing protein